VVNVAVAKDAAVGTVASGVAVGTVSVTVGNGNGDSGRGDSGTVAVGARVDVAPAFTTRGVEVCVALAVGDPSSELVGTTGVLLAADPPADRMRVALGTTVMRGTGELLGMGVDNGSANGLAGSVGEGGFVGAGPLREHATSVSSRNKDQTQRFIVISQPSQHNGGQLSASLHPIKSIITAKKNRARAGP
jgi:hypothetical protein